MKINIIYQAKNASYARGTVVIIDVFRAMTVELYLARNGARKIIPTASVDFAFEYKRKNPNSILCGEIGGAKIDGFDLGNSPKDIEKLDFSERTVVHRTSAGTQGINNANYADEIIGGSLANAKAIADYIKRNRREEVTLVCTSAHSENVWDEDNICAEYIKSLLLQDESFNIKEKIELLKRMGGSKFFDPEKQSVFPEKDFELCTRVDAFSFVLRLKYDGVSEPYMERVDIGGVPWDELLTEGEYPKENIKCGSFISEFSREDVMAFDTDLKGKVVYGSYEEPRGSFDAALVLGCPDIFMESRAKAAAKLYHEKRCSLFVTTGGVFWETPMGRLLEAEALRLYMIKEGVPPDLIVCETLARTTKENMTFSRDIVSKRVGDKIARIAVVTSYFHVTRSVALAKAFMEKAVIEGVRADYPEDNPNEFKKSNMLREFVAKEIRCLKSYVDKGWIPDFELQVSH